MFEAGAAVGVGLLVTFMKFGWRGRMFLLSNPLFMDVLIFVILVLLHWGTFSGVMAATIGATVCSISLSGARKLCGHVENNMYFPGMFDLSAKVNPTLRRPTQPA